MIDLRKIHIIDTDEVHIINIKEKSILFTGEIKMGLKSNLDYWEEGLLYGLSKTGVNFMYGNDRLTQDEFIELIK